MNNKIDARVIRTKIKLFNSFKSLLAEKTFEEITINEICLRADVRRATFYKHFSDKYDFLAGLTRSLREKFEESFNTREKMGDENFTDYYIEYLRSIVAFLDNNKDIVKLIFDSNMTASLVTVIVEENYIRTKERLDLDVKRGLKLVASPDTVAIYLAGGISNAIIKWLKTDKIPEREAFINELISLLYSVFVK